MKPFDAIQQPGEIPSLGDVLWAFLRKHAMVTPIQILEWCERVLDERCPEAVPPGVYRAELESVRDELVRRMQDEVSEEMASNDGRVWRERFRSGVPVPRVGQPLAAKKPEIGRAVEVHSKDTSPLKPQE